MTVNETLIVCKVLQEHGYGDYEMTTECGFNALGKYVNIIHSESRIINMEGNYEKDSDLPINKFIRRALLMNGKEDS